MGIRKWLLMMVCLPTISLMGQDSDPAMLNDSLFVTSELIFAEDFSRDLENWIVEQMPGGTVTVINEKMVINDKAGCTVWLKRRFEGSVMIEYDAEVIDRGGENDRVSDLNCFWMASDPESPNDFFQYSDRRTGKFSTYDPLALYYVGLGGHNNSKTRFRKYSGDGNKPLLPEHDLSDERFLITPNVINHIRLIAYGGVIQYYRNDQLIFDFHDPEPYTSGYFGIRTVHNHMTVDNVRIYRLNKRKK